jgi:hypothetical protein
MDPEAVGKAERRLAEAEGVVERHLSLLDDARRAVADTGPEGHA